MSTALLVRLCAISLSCGFLNGCFGNEATLFPGGLDPLEENLVPPFALEEGELRYEERLEVVRARAASNGETPALHGRGYVHAPLAAVWRALRTPEVAVNRREASSWSAEEASDDRYDFVVVIRTVIRRIITIEYDVTWRHGIIAGDPSAPREVRVRYQKTFGSTAIWDLQGSMVLRAVDGGTTELETIQYLGAVASGHDQMEPWFHDMFAELIALAKGLELPPLR